MPLIFGLITLQGRNPGPEQKLSTPHCTLHRLHRASPTWIFQYQPPTLLWKISIKEIDWKSFNVSFSKNFESLGSINKADNQAIRKLLLSSTLLIKVHFHVLFKLYNSRPSTCFSSFLIVSHECPIWGFKNEREREREREGGREREEEGERERKREREKKHRNRMVCTYFLVTSPITN